MNIQPDFKDFLQLLEAHQVDYMIVGGYAVAFHGYPRFTKDLDIFFDRGDANVARLRQVMIEFGFQEASVEREALLKEGNVIVIGTPPIRIDLVNSIDGVSFKDAKQRIVRGNYSDVEVAFIGREDLIRNKQSTTRSKDKADVEELE